MIALWLGAGCGPSPSQTPPVAPPGGQLPAGWIDELATDPSIFEGLMDAQDRPGWVAFHASDWRTAFGAFPEGSEPQRRARAHLAELHHDLDMLGADTWTQLTETWEKRNGMPPGSAIPVVAALATWSVGRNDEARALAARSSPQDEQVKAIALALQAPDATAALHALTGQTPLLACVQEHVFMRSRPEDSSARNAAFRACTDDHVLLREPADEGRFRVLYDPLLPGTLAALDHQAAAPEPPGTEAWPARLFSASWTGRSPDEPLMGIDPKESMALSDDLEGARQNVRTLDAALDAFVTERSNTWPEKGRQLVSELQLVQQWRGRLLQSWCAEALVASHPRRAEEYAKSALDLTHAREIGPVNSPEAFVLWARASLEVGRTREALDALRPVADAYPEVHGLFETMADLAVLEGLDRRGDSKEN